MKSVIVHAPKKPEYPCLMKSTFNETVVLFIKVSTGTCVHAGGRDTLGEYSEIWKMENFEPLNGTITLSND
jgi:hypothetical protein